MAKQIKLDGLKRGEGEPDPDSIPLGKVDVQFLVTCPVPCALVLLSMIEAAREIHEMCPEMADHLLRRVFVHKDSLGYFPGDEESIQVVRG